MLGGRVRRVARILVCALALGALAWLEVWSFREGWRLQRRVEHRYLDEVADGIDDAIARCLAAKKERRALSVGLVGNCATVLPELLRRGVEIVPQFAAADQQPERTVEQGGRAGDQAA